MVASPLYFRQLAVEHGAHAYSQDFLAEDMRSRLRSVPDGRAMAQMTGFVYDHSAIEQRFIEVDIDEIDRRHDWIRMVNQANQSLATRALLRLFNSGADPRECGALVVVSSSYSGFPSLSRRLLEPCGFSLDTVCYDLAGLGCAGPTHAIAFAHALLQQGFTGAVCVVCVDAMATHGQARHHKHAPSMAQIVAHALASDGAAALVIGRDPGPSPLFSFESCRLTSHQWPSSLDQNDLTADEDNEPFLSVGKDIRTRILPELSKVLDDDALSSSVFLHPGGAALMRSLKSRYPTLVPSADLSMSVLAEHGNLGASSLLWVLDRALRRGASIDPRFRLVALGPGIVTTSLLVDGARRLDRAEAHSPS
ncbi:MAG: hypothetical protein R3B70_00585 [Polyangiaceae bacterium]